uniref:Purinergic receptor P2Y13 n=1 Tax=Sciurus vulgaris TaxID=55149 RepID=A0A8D2B384_SCIVU
ATAGRGHGRSIALNKPTLEPTNTTWTQGSNGSERCPRDARVTQLVLPALYTGVFLAGALLNLLAFWVFLHVPSSSTFIVYLKNTVVADLIMILTLPFKILSDARLGPWQLQAFVCRVSSVVFYEAMYVGITLLGLIAFDRFLKIVRPFGKSFVKKPAFAKTVSVSIWLLFFFISLPNMILNDKEATPVSVKKCASLKSPLGLRWHQLVNYVCQAIFWTVFVMMLLFYVVIAKKVYDSYKKVRSRDGRHKQQLRGKVFVVLAVFFFCFAPFHFIRVPYTHSQISSKMACALESHLFIAKEATLFLAATNICMNPLIYIFLCKRFTERLPCPWGRRAPASNQEQQSSQTDHMTLG